MLHSLMSLKDVYLCHFNNASTPLRYLETRILSLLYADDQAANKAYADFNLQSLSD